MDKKILLIGVVLLVISIIVFFISGYLSTSGVKNSIKVNNFTVKADGIGYYPVDYKSNTSVLAIYAILSSPANLYLLNGSAFLGLSKYVAANSSASGLSYIHSLGVNSSYIQANSSVSVLPVNLKDAQVDSYFNQVIYVVVDNTPGSKSASSALNATVSDLPLSSNSIIGFAVLGYGVILLGLASIVIIIWGALKKPKITPEMAAAGDKKSTKEQKDKEYVDRLYKGVKGSKKKNTDQDE